MDDPPLLRLNILRDRHNCPLPADLPTQASTRFRINYVGVASSSTASKAKLDCFLCASSSQLTKACLLATANALRQRPHISTTVA